ncbi:hypothetical protein QA612_13075 [Evansella sp. AB-P1]|uniref:hypothetical protein n=1 Tax=Evansella sp. AB-P1 TaxID=3037653 RepID=UPI00241E9C15|nr:hypothetical protein [Evansella sp. AB-P1]MDG5788415.1 hypothetical protein [Evansella sp. AB-P1]
MKMEQGLIYSISKESKKNFFSSNTLTILRVNERSIQFSLENGKGHGTMPMEHFHYLIKNNSISEVLSKRAIVEMDNNEERIG